MHLIQVSYIVRSIPVTEDDRFHARKDDANQPLNIKVRHAFTLGKIINP